MKDGAAFAMTVMKELENEYKRLAKTFDPDLYHFLVGSNSSFYSIGTQVDYDNKYCKEIYQTFLNGGKPSDFFKTKEEEMKDYFSTEYFPLFYYAVDHVCEWQISESVYRRSYRSGNYWLYIEKILRICRDFRNLSLCGADMYSLLAEKADEKLIAFMRSGNVLVSEAMIAAALDLGDAGLEKVLEDIIMGEYGKVSVLIIRGIVMSHNRKMHELLGKLLLAARQQEGLRQAICENMDRGTREAFLYLLGVIAENGLMRFSSVKRAVAVCTGLLSAEEKDDNRITEKQIGLIMDYLQDPRLREKAFEGEDSMEIYLALWGYAFDNIDVAMDRAIRLMRENSHHTRLVAAYFITKTDIPYSVNAATIEVFKQHSEEMDVVAMIMPEFMSCVEEDFFELLSPYLSCEKDERPEKRLFTDYRSYFESPEQTREIYNLLKALLERMPGRKVTFSSLVFPWNDEMFTSADVVERMGFCASALQDEQMMQEVAEKLNVMPSSGMEKGYLVYLLLDDPGTPQMLRLLTQCVCDSEAYTRSVAAKLLARVAEKDTRDLDPRMAAPEGALPDMCYEMLEGMLRLKKANLRAQVISLLMTMPDEKLIGVIGRVLADKSEEKRTAGLDMVLQLKKKHSPCLQSALKAVESITDPSTKESILIKEIVGEEKAQKGKAFGYGLYDVNASYEPILESSYLEKCKMQFQKTFGPSADASLELQILKELDDLIGQNKEREYQTFCGTKLLGDFVDLIRVDGKMQLPFPEIWEAFYQNHIRTTEELLRLKVLLTNMITRDNRVRGVCDHFKPILREIFGEDMWLDNLGELKRLWHYYKIIGQLAEEKLSPRILADYAAYLAYCLAVHKKELDYQYTAADLNNEWECRGTDPGVTFSISIVFFGAVGYLLGYMKDSKEGFPYFYNLAKQNQFDYEEDSGLAYKGKDTKYYLQPADYISACAAGFISGDFLLKTLMDENMRKETLSSLSDVVIYVRETGKTMASKGYVYYWKIRHQKEIMQRLLGKELPEKKTDMEYDEQDRKVIDLALDCFEKISRVILDVELTRGDTATEFSGQITCLNRLYGVEYLVRILAALGKETLDRNNYWGQAVSKRSCLSHLLKCCMPDYREGDQKQQAEKLAALIKGTDIRENRLIEACLFTPEWIDIVGTYLGWDGFTSGCYYFIAHMNEKFSEDKMALIARYTPLSEKELNNGAFDRNWFEEVYDQLGKKRFDMIYSAAKYISDGSRHTRARKYADAARGEMDAQKVKEEIEAKRNKDLLMAYGLIPGTEKEICERYEFIRKFEKESGRFGAQRRAAEKLAAEMAIKNMATAAGYSDETGFILKMEGMVSSGREACWEPHAVGEYLVHLAMDENGRIDLVIQKGGKKLSSVPAVIKKEEYLVNLQEAKKTLTEQYRRTRQMMEEAMEAETAFTMEEVQAMRKNPVSAQLVDRLIFKAGDIFGFPEELQQKGIAGTEKFVIAHPLHLFRAGLWRDYQQMIFEKQIRQPFKQIFRELYIKTEEEKGLIYSERYAGNQIQPKRTMALLGSRKWLTDEESGLQRIFYKRNIIAKIFALADWFSPSDIEAPTLEWVCFADRKDFHLLLMEEVPDVIFSEVMRDVDLAVSVAHAGGVDPEMSHSTLEMRKAVAEFTVASFGLDNVRFTATHAIVKGSRGNYTVHLGSGVIHQEGGSMINVLPVHSQRRGRLFLPFVDDDPKTAEVLSKILLFAEDRKIKDPFISNQIV